MKNSALLGYSGFVGSNILRQQSFEYLYDSKNIEQIKNREFEYVVCAATPGIKWQANKAPEKDYESIQSLIKHLQILNTQKIVLISTIDVYPTVDKVNEDSKIKKEELSPYGKHRRMLEEFVEVNFSSTIIRLPGLFGKGLKGNPIYDLMNGVHDYIHQDSIMQFYNLDNICKDISTALKNNLKFLNFATEPISIKEIATEVFNTSLKNGKNSRSLYYDMHTRFAQLWNKAGNYLYLKNDILSELNSFVETYE